MNKYNIGDKVRAYGTIIGIVKEISMPMHTIYYRLAVPGHAVYRLVSEDKIEEVIESSDSNKRRRDYYHG